MAKRKLNKKNLGITIIITLVFTITVLVIINAIISMMLRHDYTYEHVDNLLDLPRTLINNDYLYKDEYMHYEDDEYYSITGIDVSSHQKDIDFNKLYVIANLPYYITTPIIEKMINNPIDVEAMVLMVQNEVADRLSANVNSKEYAAITVFLNYYYNVEKLFFVPRAAFDPVPNVDSAVIKLSRRERKYECNNEKVFFKLVRDAFAMKRKNLRNNLKSYDLNTIESVLLNYKLSLQDRAEKVPVQCFVDIANEISK